MEAAAAVVQQPVSAQVVGDAFVQKYYHMLYESPGLVHRFYQDISKLGRPEEDGLMSITTTMQAINEKILSLNYGDVRAEINSVDAQESFNGGIHVLVTGSLSGNDNKIKKFSQTFFLAPQERGYFVLNDIFRYVNNVTLNPALVSDIMVPIASEPVQENHASELSIPSTEEAVAGEVYNPPENGDVPIAEEEVPVAEVVDELQDETEVVAESDVKIDDVPKNSYASMVMRLKETAAHFSSPRLNRVVPLRRNAQDIPISFPATDGQVSSLDSVHNEHNQEGEADGYSIYVKGLPMNATEALLEEVFNKFGTIKKDIWNSS